MNYPLCAVAVVTLVGFAAIGCSKKEEAVATKADLAPPPVTVAVVAPSERSAHFLAVSNRLELGGTLFGYVDIDGDAMKVTEMVNEFAKDLAAKETSATFLKHDFTKVVKGLGLADIKAAGVSSVKDASGFYRNQMFLYAPEKRSGLLAGLGGVAKPFASVGMGPVDTDVYFETEMDLPAVYTAVRELMAELNGEEEASRFEAQLKRKTGNVVFSVHTLIHGAKGRASGVLRLDPVKTVPIPLGKNGAMNIPNVSLVLCVEGIGAIIEPQLVKTKELKVSGVGTMKFYEVPQALPIEGLQPVFAVDGNTLYIATSRGFLDECLAASASGLAQTETFRSALAQVGTEGNGLSYVSPRFFETIRKLDAMNSHLPAEMREGLARVLKFVPQTNRPMIAVRSNVPDGILITSYMERSLKQDVALLSVYNPVTIGLMASMAIPAFEKVRSSSLEKAVINNLRQLSAAAEQYYLETGTTSATYDDLVGPTKYIREITSVGGENYRTLVFKSGRPLQLSVPKLKKTVTYR
jgi:type IV pilus assembly protein PilA